MPNTQTSYRLPPITPLAVIFEWVIIGLVAWLATTTFSQYNPSQKLPGGEAEWLTSSAYLTSLNFQAEGYIPRWEPWFAFGEPLIDNPFSFVLNPISTLPSLIYGGLTGIKLSVVLTAFLVGLGGWTLGRVLGFGTLARVFLGLILIGKGNMLAMIGAGYFQLGVSQAYLPWIIAGTVALLRTTRRRWPIVLTVVSFTLLFWAGNIWYTLPMLIMMLLLTASHTIYIRRETLPITPTPVEPLPNGVQDDPPLPIAESIALPDLPPDAVVADAIDTSKLPKTLIPSWIILDQNGIRRMALTLVLIACFSAVSLLPIWANKDRIGGHPNEIISRTGVDMGRVLTQFVNGDIALYNQNAVPGQPQFYYSFIMPLWFGVLIFIVLPPIRALAKPGTVQGWRIWSVTLFMIVFTLVWGVGGSPIFDFLYQSLPLLGQWRFVGRALAVTSFGIAILMAARVDGLWRAVVESPVLLRRLTIGFPQIAPFARAAVAVGLIVACAVVTSQLNQQWFVFAGVTGLTTPDETCITWLRQKNPDKQLAVYGPGYYVASTYLANHVRLFNIAADFHLIPTPGTLYHVDLTQSLPEYGLAWIDDLRTFLKNNGYELMRDSPSPVDSSQCLYQNTHTFSYAYSIPEAALLAFDSASKPLAVEATTPITSLDRHLDHIALVVDGTADMPLVVTLQELAYPGWMVQIDGRPAALKSIGGQIGVLMPAGAVRHQIYFYYDPPLVKIGMVITLATWVFLVLYLLYADRLIPPSVRTRFGQGASRLVPLMVRTRKLLLNSRIFEPHDDPKDS